ncbi:MAG TPA: CBS domain-containing protein [Longimicrobiales bacterium]|nr:CBS domain-containing protein [Longimicrobiales bacterium]
MRLAELFEGGWAVLPVSSGDLAGALEEILGRAAAAGTMEATRAAKLARDLAFGAQGEVVRLSDDVVAVLGSDEDLGRLSWTVGVAPGRLRVSAEGLPEPASANIVILALVPGRLTGLRQDLLPVLGRVLRDPGRAARVLAACSPGDILAVPGLGEAEFHPQLRVEDALVPVRHRVYPETPLEEVVDLLAGRGIHAVPVVGQRYEVLGVLTSGDALAYLLQSGGPGGQRRGRSDAVPRVARDFMTRTVLCVSEEQSLAEAAHMMVNRDVEQLPVVRDGELVGFVTRDSILGALHAAPGPKEPE